MAIDPNIALQVHPVSPVDPLAQVGKAYAIRSAMAQTEREQAQTADIQAQAAQRQRDLEANNRLQGVLADPANHAKFASGDFSPIYQARISPNIAIPAVENHLKMQKAANDLQVGKAAIQAEGLSKLKNVLASLPPEGKGPPEDPNNDEAAAAAYNAAIPRLSQLHPELASELQPLTAGPDFRQRLQHIAGMTGVAHEILKGKAALDKEQAATEAEAAKAKAELAGAGKSTLEQRVLQHKLDLYDTLRSTPEALQTRVAKSIDPQKYPAEYARALNDAQNAPDLEGITAAIEKHSQNVSTQEREMNVSPLGRAIAQVGGDPNKPEDIAKGRKLLQQEAIQQHVAAAVATATALNPPAPLDTYIYKTGAGRQYVNRAEVGKDRQAVQAARAQGIPIVDAPTHEMLTEVDNARENLDYMQSRIGSKLATDPTGRLFSAPANTIEKLAQTDPDLAAVGTFRSAAIQSMRAVAGSKGLRVNRAEIEQAQENDIPKLTDTLPVARQKLANMKAFLDNVENSHLQRDRSAGNQNPSQGKVAGAGPVATHRFNPATGKIEPITQ